MKADISLAVKMMNLFSGSTRAHGTHGLPEWEDGKSKWGIKKTVKTVKGPPTRGLWQEHLSGTRPLGVIPIREDNTCSWGSIDYDEYGADILAVVERVLKLRLPLVPCRSKSGGLHLFAFFVEPSPAAEVQAALTSAAKALDLPSFEIFPKQTRLDASASGNWILMPYFGDTFDGKLKNQHGLKKNGSEMSCNEFWLHANERMTTIESLAAVVGKQKSSNKRLRSVLPTGSDMPPCLETFGMRGVSSMRNNALFQFGIFARLKFGENWKAEIKRFNESVMQPPLDSTEVESTIKSLAKRDYGYTCKIEPMLSVCDRAACLLCHYGVRAAPGLHIESIEISKTEPKQYHIKIEGSEVTVTNRELNNFRYLNGECIEQANMSFVPVKEATFNAMVSAALSQAKYRDIPQDIAAGQEFRDHLNAFCNDYSRTDRWEDVPSGRPFLDTETGRHYFTLAAFQLYLKRHDPKGAETRHKIAKQIRALSGDEHVHKPTGRKAFRCWYVPEQALDGAPDPIPPPRLSGGEI
jgi:hypothetical protein